MNVDEQFDLLALFFACRGTCDRLRTSTVIRDAKDILIAAGYNGAISGSPHCDDEDVGHLMVEGHCLRTNHGEENALLNCLDLSRIEGGVVTVVGSPCLPCVRKLAAKNPRRVRYIGAYQNSQGGGLVKDLCKERGIELEYMPIEKILETFNKAMKFLQGPGGPFKDLKKIKII